MSALCGKQIIPGKTLLFFDEIQECTQAIMFLRFFKEEMPDIHVIAAGLIIPVTHSDANGLPLGSEVDKGTRKMLLLDSGSMLRL